jgi:hypothetical protein
MTIFDAVLDQGLRVWTRIASEHRIAPTDSSVRADIHVDSKYEDELVVSYWAEVFYDVACSAGRLISAFRIMLLGRLIRSTDEFAFERSLPIATLVKPATHLPRWCHFFWEGLINEMV